MCGIKQMIEHGTVEWQLEQAEETLRDILAIAKDFKSKPYQKIAFLADHVLTHNTITRMAQQAGRKSLGK